MPGPGFVRRNGPLREARSVVLEKERQPERSRRRAGRLRALKELSAWRRIETWQHVDWAVGNGYLISRVVKQLYKLGGQHAHRFMASGYPLQQRFVSLGTVFSCLLQVRAPLVSRAVGLDLGEWFVVVEGALVREDFTKRDNRRSHVRYSRHVFGDL